MAFVQITDPDKSWELLQAGLLWFKGESSGYAPYDQYLLDHWKNMRSAWCAISGDTVPHDKYVLIEE